MSAYVSLSDRVAEARNEATGPERLRELAADSSSSVRAAVAGRSDLPIDVAGQLAHDAAQEVLVVVAANPATPPSTLQTLASTSPMPLDLVRALASNPTSPTRMLESFGKSWHRWDVQRLLGANPSTPPEMLWKLSKSNVWPVRAAVASNRACDSKLLRLLSGDVNAVQFEVAGNPATPTDLLVSLVGWNPFSAARVAANPSTPASVLDQITREGHHPSWVVRRAATNPACPREAADAALTWLSLGGANDDPAFDPATCLGFPSDRDTAPGFWYRQEALRWGDQAATSPLWRVRSEWMNGRKMSQRALEQLAADPNVVVRRRAAGFRPLAAATIGQLMNDEDAAVAAAAVEAAKAPAPAQARRRVANRSSARTGLAVAIALVAVGWIAQQNPSTVEPSTAGLDNQQVINSLIAQAQWTVPTTAPAPEASGVRSDLAYAGQVMGHVRDGAAPSPVIDGPPLPYEQLALWQCFNDPVKVAATFPSASCTDSHHAQVVAIATDAPADWPATCLATVEARVGAGEHPTVLAGYFNVGNRSICAVVFANELLTRTYAGG